MWGRETPEFTPEPRALVSDPRRQSPASSAAAIRLFVSSTFRDMQNEREALRRDVFPIVQRLCEERGVSFFEIDLRWGVTAAEAEDGRVLSICLEEIDRCRPFVLGLMGARYGWVDPRAKHTLESNERFRCLLSDAERDASVTELELRYATLNRPADAPEPLALIYRRPPSEPSVGLPTGFAKLAEELTASGIPVHDTSADIGEFAARVRDDLVTEIEKRLPRAPATERERAQRAARDTATALGLRYVDRPAAGLVLDLVHRRRQRIAIVGAPGSGKSMISAAVARALYAGEGAPSETVAALAPAGFRLWSDALAAIVTQIAPSAPGQGTVGYPENKTRAMFHDAVAAAAERGPVTVVIDGVDDKGLSESQIPAWCPDPIDGATIVVALRGTPEIVRALKRDGWNVVELAVLARGEAGQFCEKYLAAYGRRLDAGQLATVTAHPRFPLELALLLEEIRVVERFEDLPGEIARLAAITGAAELIDAVLDRIVREHAKTAAGALAALAVAPDGLPESVLRAAARKPGDPVVPWHFELLRGALGKIASVNTERVTLRSPVFSARILARLPDGAKSARADTIERLRSDLAAPGAAEETLRHLLALRCWDEIADVLADRAAFDGLARRAGQQLRAFWSRLREYDGSRGPQIYRSWIGIDPPRRVAEVAALLEDLGEPELAAEFAHDAMTRGRAIDPAAVAVGASVLAGLAEARGDFAAAMALLAEIDSNEFEAVVPQARAVAALRRARIALVRSGPVQAQRDMDLAAAAVARLGDERLNAVLLALRGAVAQRSGDLRAARAIFAELKALGDRLGDLGVLATAEVGLAKIERLSGKLARAEAAARRARRFAKIAGDNRIIQDALGIDARVQMELGNLDGASDLIRRRRTLTKDIADVVGQLEAEVDFAQLHVRLGDAAEAERIMARVGERAKSHGIFIPDDPH